MSEGVLLGTLIGGGGVGAGPGDNGVDFKAPSAVGVNATVSELSGITCKGRTEVRLRQGLV